MQPPASAQHLLDAYEAQRAGLPACNWPESWCRAHQFDDLADRYDAFFFDAFGVLNIGDTPIAGAAERLSQLRSAGRKLVVVSNAAATPPLAFWQKLCELGFDLKPTETVTSREALTTALAQSPRRVWGVVAPAGADVSDLPGPWIHLGDQPARTDQAEGFLLLASLASDELARSLLLHSLQRKPRPVWVANADLAAPRETGFSVEPGALAHWLATHAPVKPTLFGKPFSPVFRLALQRLPAGTKPARVLMVGDTLHTDVWGGCAAGLHTALVVGQGASAALDWADAIARTGVVPNHVVDRL